MDEKLFQELVNNVKLSVDYVQGRPVKNVRIHRIAVPKAVDVRAIRKKLHMTRETFAATFGFSASGVSKWENGERTPEGSARVLLSMISKDPLTVLRLASSGKPAARPR